MQADAVFKAVEDWKKKCLLKDGSVFLGDSLWTLGNLNNLNASFIEKPIEGSESNFWEKFQTQLDKTTPSARQLAAEMLWVMFLFPSTITHKTKQKYVKQVWGWSGNSLNDQEMLMEPLKYGIGGCGQRYNMRRYSELSYFIRLMIKWKQLNSTQNELLSDAWKFGEWIEAEMEEKNHQFRHILLHLLFPDKYERIATDGHKKQVLETFKILIEDNKPNGNPSSVDFPETDRDRDLFDIREKLEEHLPSENLDYYTSPLKEVWMTGEERNGSLNPIEALLLRKQIILYGPPGTSKTYSAKELAKKFIQSDLIRKERAQYFQHSSEFLEEVFKKHIFSLQFHPNYSYEDFIGGLKIAENGQTKYEKGFFFKTINEDIAALRNPDDITSELPFVFIFDEINRADLSRVFGETFSLLENRGEEVCIPGSGGEKFCIPNDIYIIGTMNLIDQSLEQIDFALRRRFIWIAHGFSVDSAREIFRSKLEKICDSNNFDYMETWSRLEEDIECLLISAARLNHHIAQDEYLGPDYEIGHTYFCETLPMLIEDIKRRGRKNFFWQNDKPQPPLTALWKHYLSPLLEQYLAGLPDRKQRQQKLDNFSKVFYDRKTESI